MNIGSFPARRALLSPGDLAAVDGGRRVTFGELNARCNRAARLLLDLGVAPGDRVGVLLPNSLEWLESFFAGARIGAIVVPLNWRLSPEELAVVCADAGVETLIYTSEMAAAEGLFARHEFRQRLTVGRRASGQAVAYAEAVAAQSAAPVNPRGGDEDPLLIIYTSGTTGRPKGAVHTHRHWFWAATTVAASQDLRPGDRGLVVAPMFHVGGLVMSTLHTYVGAASVYMRAFDAEEVLRLVREERIAHFLCVPTMLNMIREHASFEGADFSSVRWCFAVGAPTPPSLIEAFSRRGLCVQVAYGLTETGGPATVVPPASVLEKLGSVGVPFFHTDIRVVDQHGAPAAAGALGEVEIRAPHVIDQYWRNPQATVAALHDGWLRTGDVGRLDADSYLYLVDRKHDLIISGGENVYPTEVERAIVEHTAVADAVVFSLADETWGEIVCAAVQPQSHARVTEPDLIAFCRTRLAGYKVPRRIFFLQELPRTATGKSLRRELRLRLGART